MAVLLLLASLFTIDYQHRLQLSADAFGEFYDKGPDEDQLLKAIHVRYRYRVTWLKCPNNCDGFSDRTFMVGKLLRMEGGHKFYQYMKSDWIWMFPSEGNASLTYVLLRMTFLRNEKFKLDGDNQDGEFIASLEIV